MSTVEERISSLEGKMDAIGHVESAIAELRTGMNRRFDESRADMNRQFAEVNRRFGEIDRHSAEVNRQFGEINRQFDDVNRRFGEVDRRFEQVDYRFGQIDRRLDVLDQRMERHFMWLVGIQFTVLLTVIVALIRLSPG